MIRQPTKAPQKIISQNTGRTIQSKRLQQAIAKKEKIKTAIAPVKIEPIPTIKNKETQFKKAVRELPKTAMNYDQKVESLKEWAEENREILSDPEYYEKGQKLIKAEEQKLERQNIIEKSQVLSNTGIEINAQGLAKSIKLPTSNVQQRPGDNTSVSPLSFFKITAQGDTVFNKAKYKDYIIEYRPDNTIKRIYKKPKTYNIKEYNNRAENVGTYIPEEYIFNEKGNLIKKVVRDDYEYKQYYDKIREGKPKGKIEFREVYEDKIYEWNDDGSLKSFEDYGRFKINKNKEIVDKDPRSNKRLKTVQKEKWERYNNGMLSWEKDYEYNQDAQLDEYDERDYLSGRRTVKDKTTDLEKEQIEKKIEADKKALKELTGLENIEYITKKGIPTGFRFEAGGRTYTTRSGDFLAEKIKDDALNKYYGKDSGKVVDITKKVGLEDPDRIAYNLKTGGRIDRALQQSIDPDISLKKPVKEIKSIYTPFYDVPKDEILIPKTDVTILQDIRTREQLKRTRGITPEESASNLIAAAQVPIFTPETSKYVEAQYESQVSGKNLAELEKDIKYLESGVLKSDIKNPDPEKLKLLEERYSTYEKEYKKYQPASEFIRDWKLKTDIAKKESDYFTKELESLPGQVLKKGYKYDKSLKELELFKKESLASKQEYLYRLDPLGTKISKKEKNEFLDVKGPSKFDIISLSKNSREGFQKEINKEKSIIGKTKTTGLSTLGTVGKLFRPAGTYFENVGKGFQGWSNIFKGTKAEKPFAYSGAFLEGTGKGLKYKPVKTGGLALLAGGINVATAGLGSVGAGLATTGRVGQVAVKTGKAGFALGGIALGGAYVGETYIEAQAVEPGIKRAKFYGERFGAEGFAMGVGGFVGGKAVSGLRKKGFISYDPRTSEKLDIIYGKKTLGDFLSKGVSYKKKVPTKTILDELATIPKSEKGKIISRRGQIKEGLKRFSESEFKEIAGLKKVDVIPKMRGTTELELQAIGKSKGLTDFNIKLTEKYPGKEQYILGESVQFRKGSLKRSPLPKGTESGINRLKQLLTEYKNENKYFTRQERIKKVLELPEYKTGFTERRSINLQSLENKNLIRLREVDGKTYIKKGDEPLSLLQKSIFKEPIKIKKETLTFKSKEVLGKDKTIPLKEFKKGRQYEEGLFFRKQKEVFDIYRYDTGFGGKAKITRQEQLQSLITLPRKTTKQTGIAKSDKIFYFESKDPIGIKKTRKSKGIVEVEDIQFLPKFAGKTSPSYIKKYPSEKFALGKTKAERRIGRFDPLTGEKVLKAPEVKIPGLAQRKEIAQAPIKYPTTSISQYKIEMDVFFKGGKKRISVGDTNIFQRTAARVKIAKQKSKELGINIITKMPSRDIGLFGIKSKTKYNKIKKSKIINVKNGKFEEVPVGEQMYSYKPYKTFEKAKGLKRGELLLEPKTEFRNVIEPKLKPSKAEVPKIRIGSKILEKEIERTSKRIKPKLKLGIGYSSITGIGRKKKGIGIFKGINKRESKSLFDTKISERDKLSNKKKSKIFLGQGLIPSLKSSISTRTKDRIETKSILETKQEPMLKQDIMSKINTIQKIENIKPIENIERIRPIPRRPPEEPIPEDPIKKIFGGIKNKKKNNKRKKDIFSRYSEREFNILRLIKR